MVGLETSVTHCLCNSWLHHFNNDIVFHQVLFSNDINELFRLELDYKFNPHTLVAQKVADEVIFYTKKTTYFFAELAMSQR